MKAVIEEVPPEGSAPAAGKKLKVFLVDDHSLFRRGMAGVIQNEPDLRVCGEAHSAQQAIDALRTTESDAVVLDISLPGANGIELLKQIRAEHPTLPVLVLSMYDETQYALRALRAGASGYLMKSEPVETFLSALRKVLSKQIFVSSTFGEQLIYKVAKGEDAGTGSPVDVLSDRELEVLQLVGGSKSTREIAELLHLSVKTVESHRLHIREKLGLKSAPELVRFAIDWVGQQSH